MNYSLLTAIRLQGLIRVGSQALILASLTLGFVLTWGADDVVQRLLRSPQPLSASTTPLHTDGDATSGQSTQYVQDPLTRSSFRPDFSSSLRHANQRNNFNMLRAFSEAIVDARLSTVRLLNSNGDPVALGAIVDANGWIATKASQLPISGDITVQLADNTEAIAEVVQKVLDVDIALLRIPRSGLPVIQWAANNIPPRGTWLATTSVDKMPSAVGVVSAGIQSIRSARPVLGVELIDSSAGAAVIRVLMGTGADKAGLKVGDNIIAVNGTSVASYNAFKRAIEPGQGGEVVKLTVNRGEREFEASARLMDLSDELLDETEMEVNGPVSARATGFTRVFLHDTVLEPTQCGGPLCNLDGKVVGLNIARAGRVSSYALPADVARPLIEGLVAQATLVSRPVSPASATTVR